MDHVIKLSNSQRLRKVETYTGPSKMRDRPRAYFKCLSIYQKPIFMQKMDYDYETDNKVLRELKQSFKSKCNLYFPKSRRTKMGKKENSELKERIQFQPKKNPVLAMFNKLNSKLVRPVLLDSLNELKDTFATLLLLEKKN